MKDRQRRDRAYTRRRRATRITNGSCDSARVLDIAGSTAGVGGHVEALEPRKLLFAMEIGPDNFNPNLGLGTDVATFGYVLPYQLATVPESEDVEDLSEDFNEVDTGIFTRGTPSENGFLVTGQAQTVPLRVVTVGGEDMQRQLLVSIDGVDPDTGEASLYEIGFGETDGDDLVRQDLLSISFNVGEGGFDLTGNTVIELVNRRGEVIETLEGASLAAAFVGGGGPEGQILLESLDGNGNQQGFVTVRITNNSDDPLNFSIDDVVGVPPEGRYAELINSRIFGVIAVFTGPLGARAEFLDLYGRDILETIELGILDGGEIALVDTNDDGVPDFNDGIGSITITGTDTRSSLTLYGGFITATDNAFQLVLADDITGNYAAFADAGLDNFTPFLTPGPGSVVIGSPWVRDNSSALNYLIPAFVPPPVAVPEIEFTSAYVGFPDDPVIDFASTNQGIFINDGSDIGSVLVHGILMGQSTFSGAVGRLVISDLYGTVSVDGDLGTFVLAGEGGINGLGVTGSTLTVGRTLGQFHVAGRNAINVTVLGDVNNPNRSRLNALVYNERENIAPVSPDAGETATVSNIQGTGLINVVNVFGDGVDGDGDWRDQPIPFSISYFRNDDFLSAEIINGPTTTVQVIGSAGSANNAVDEVPDIVDVYAFAVDGTRDVILQGSGGYTRILDADGRVLAAYRSIEGRYVESGEGEVTFTPNGAGVYYLVVTGAPQYNIVISGIATTTWGGARIGSNSLNTNFVLQGGSMGSMRVGTGHYSGRGGPNYVEEFIGDVDGAGPNVFLASGAFNLSVEGDLWNITAGNDITQTPSVLVGGDFGNLITGLTPLLGFTPEQGDVDGLTLIVGGRISAIDVKGAIGYSQDVDPQDGGVEPMGNASMQTFTIVTGTRAAILGTSGDIGQILVGAFVAGDSLSVQTSPGSEVGLFRVGTTGGDAASTTGNLFGELRSNPSFFVGPGSDVRFVDFGRNNDIDPDSFLEIRAGETIRIIDDAGAAVLITIVSDDPEADEDSIVRIRAIPVEGSLGVAIGRIDATLTNGAQLRIAGETAGTVSIGRINVTGTDESTGLETVIITGQQTEIDVYNITSSILLARVENTSNQGDIVSADILALTEMIIGTGNLGLTEVSGIGPSIIGPWVGINPGAGSSGYLILGDGRNGPLNLNEQTVQDFIDGPYFGLRLDDPQNPEQFLDDIGSPYDGYLNGLVVRTGEIQLVSVGGAVGDVIVEQGSVVRVVANADGTTLMGDFDGIIGTIYAGGSGAQGAPDAGDILFVDVGDGIISPGPSSFAAAGIFAADDIIDVVGRGTLDPVINGVISAANVVPTDPENIDDDDAPAEIDGIINITITNGLFDGAFISSSILDAFWTSARVADGIQEDDVRGGLLPGGVTSIRGIGTDFFRSNILTEDLLFFSLTNGGAYDASQITTFGDAGTIEADEFRNSTFFGIPAEFVPSSIEVGDDLATLRATTGDIVDLSLDVLGSVSNGIFARTIDRSSFNVDNNIRTINASVDIRNTTVVAGRLETLTATRNIAGSDFVVSGPIFTVTVNNSIINSVFSSFGPDARIDTITVMGDMEADVSVTGPIGTIRSTTGDIRGTIISSDEDDAGLTRIQADRDIIINLLVEGDAGTIMAGRHIGVVGALNERLIDIRGNLSTIEATDGQIYSNVFVGQDLTTAVRTGRVANLPGNDLVSRMTLEVQGSITMLDLTSDFAGTVISRSGGIGMFKITDGSLRLGASIIVADGDLEMLEIQGGHLLGDITVDGSIGSLMVTRGLDNFGGSIGIPSFNPNQPWDEFRNVLPPDTAIDPTFQGPIISATHDIENVVVEFGGFFEAGLYAGREIGEVTVFRAMRNDDVTKGGGGSFIAAGDRIGDVSVGQFGGGVIIVAGVTDLGEDGRAGGTGVNADTVIGNARIDSVTFGGSLANVQIAAGINADPTTGRYDGALATIASGNSSIGSVFGAGTARATTVRADAGVGPTSAGIKRGGANLAQADDDRVIADPTGTQIASGTLFNFTTSAGERGSAILSGPGELYWSQSLGRLTVVGTNNDSELVVTQTGTFGRFTNLDILSGRNASLGTLTIDGIIRGDETKGDVSAGGQASNVFIDGDIGTLNVVRTVTDGFFGAGGNIGTFNSGSLIKGNFTADELGTLNISGALGRTQEEGEALFLVRDAENVNISGRNSGTFSSDYTIESADIGRFERGALRSGGSIEMLDTGDVAFSRISARDHIMTLNVGGVDDSLFYAGVDLGRDGRFGGTGFDADTVTDGNIGNVDIDGDFVESDIAAGVARGADAFVGTDDDPTAGGRSNIGNVTIAGTQVGSLRGSESYRITASGTIGNVTLSGLNLVQIANFRVEPLSTSVLPIVVSDLRVDAFLQEYTIEIQFNQAADSSTLSDAITVSEIRDGSVFVTLVEGTDYAVDYDADMNTALVRLNSVITGSNTPGGPDAAPGLYRVEIDADVLRGETVDTALDGNADGTVGDNFIRDIFVGDVGDKIVPDGTPDGVDFGLPADLTTFLDADKDGNLDINSVFRLDGFAGDHPDANPFTFNTGGDVDVYAVDLRQGQIIRFGGVAGNAFAVGRAFLNADPMGVAPAQLPASSLSFLVQETGTYFLLVGGAASGMPIGAGDFPIDDDAELVNLPAIPNATGNYSFTVEVFDDGDTGFAGTEDSSDGTALVNAPVPTMFAGDDGIFDTADDLATISAGGFTFTLDAGQDGVKGTADDLVSGDNGDGIVSTRTATDSTFGNPNDLRRITIDSDLGGTPPTGSPITGVPDIDVYHLNNRNPIQPGTRIRITMNLGEEGLDLGLDPLVQLALFEVTDTTGFRDADLVASPTDFLNVAGGVTPQTIADDGQTAYGYNANGDFFWEFALPPQQGAVGDPAGSFAIYVQGTSNSNYRLVVETFGRTSFALSTQNVFIETRGGTVDWLEAGDGLVTELGEFDASVLGLEGTIGLQFVDDFILTNLVDALNTAFGDYEVVFSTNVSDFEGQDFSTVFLTSSNEPPERFNDATFGVSEHSDPFNADKNDEAVVFLPSLSLLGVTPSQAGAEQIVGQLTAAIGRRVGELVGLRGTLGDPSTDIMAEGSVVFAPPFSQALPITQTPSDTSAPLGVTSTMFFRQTFFLGNQTSGELLDRILVASSST